MKSVPAAVWCFYSGKRIVKCLDYCLKAIPSLVCESMSPACESVKYIIPGQIHNYLQMSFNI